MNISFFPKKSKRHVSTLYITSTIDNETQDISSGFKVNPATWSSDKDIMEFTHNVRKKLVQVHNTMVQEKVNITVQRVMEAYLAKHVDIRTVVVELQKMIERDKIEVIIGNRSKSAVQKTNVCLRHLTSFLAARRLTDVSFDEIAATIYTDSSGAKWIDSKRVKTGVDYDVPLFPQVLKILEKYDYKLPVRSNQKMNAYLKEIADVCGVTKNMTIHMATGTFASIMNEQGVNITAILRMLGHTKITTTQHYITTNRQFLKDEMKKASQSLGDMFA